MIETAEVKLTNAGVNVEVFKDAHGVLRGGFGSDDMDRNWLIETSRSGDAQIIR